MSSTMPGLEASRWAPPGTLPVKPNDAYKYRRDRKGEPKHEPLLPVLPSNQSILKPVQETAEGEDTPTTVSPSVGQQVDQSIQSVLRESCTWLLNDVEEERMQRNKLKKSHSGSTNATQIQGTVVTSSISTPEDDSCDPALVLGNMAAMGISGLKNASNDKNSLSQSHWASDSITSNLTTPTPIQNSCFGDHSTQGQTSRVDGKCWKQNSKSKLRPIVPAFLLEDDDETRQQNSDKYGSNPDTNLKDSDSLVP